MTVPRYRPHQVRQQLNLRSQDTRTLQIIRGTAPAPAVGAGGSLPTFAAATFHWPFSAGAIATGLSDARTVRWNCALVACVVDVTSWSTNFSLTVYVGGSAVTGLNPTANITGNGNFRFLCNPITLFAYVSTLQIAATTPGTGNKGVFVALECV